MSTAGWGRENSLCVMGRPLARRQVCSRVGRSGPKAFLALTGTF